MMKAVVSEDDVFEVVVVVDDERKWRGLSKFKSGKQALDMSMGMVLELRIVVEAAKIAPSCVARSENNPLQ